MKVNCSGPNCQRRFEAPEGHSEYFCSIECACYAGRFSVTKGWLPDSTNPDVDTIPSES